MGNPWKPPTPAPAGHDRLIERTRRALTDPARLILPLQERANLRQVFLPAAHSALRDPAVVAVHAEAGVGKSVLLGQIYDGLAAEPDIGVVLVSAAAKTAERPRSVTELDVQFGDAVGRRGPLSGWWRCSKPWVFAHRPVGHLGFDAGRGEHTDRESMASIARRPGCSRRADVP
jgi:hypothetical protein